MSDKVSGGISRIKVHDMPQENLRSGGEARPFDFPHLYRVRAGDWRISYAVEHNRLAVLVLEVLQSEKSPEEDPEREETVRKMKVKLLSPPEGEDRDPASGGALRRSRVRLLNPANGGAAASAAARRVKLLDRNEGLGDPTLNEGGDRSRVTLLDVEPLQSEETFEDELPGAEEDIIEGKVTPLDSPSS